MENPQPQAISIGDYDAEKVAKTPYIRIYWMFSSANSLSAFLKLNAEALPSAIFITRRLRNRWFHGRIITV
jgi:hypothetical protein